MPDRSPANSLSGPDSPAAPQRPSGANAPRRSRAESEEIRWAETFSIGTFRLVLMPMLLLLLVLFLVMWMILGT